MLLSHHDRHDRICVLTLDPVLSQDICRRIAQDPKLSSTEVLRPQETGREITVDAIMRLTRLTVTCKIMVLDVRRSILPRVQAAYNRVSGYNRRDFNDICFSVAIGDGPPGLASNSVGIEGFRPLLAQARLDYNAAAFFFDPFTQYGPGEQPLRGIDSRFEFPEELPADLAGILPPSVRRLTAARAYVRSGSSSQTCMAEVKQSRQAEVRAALIQLARRHGLESAEACEEAMSPEGTTRAGDILPLRCYPFHFEDCLSELLDRTSS